MFQHLMNCSEFQHILSINRYHDVFPIDQNLGLDINQDLDFNNSLIQAVINKTVLDKAVNWGILLIKEGLYIKNFSPTLNNGFQYTRQPQLF